MNAVQYDDDERAFAGHVLSTDSSPYCIDSFARVLSKVKENATDAGCEEARALTGEEIQGLDDEARLIAQMTRTVCEDPTIDCIGYSQRVFETMWSEKPELVSFELKKVLGDETQAAAYVDLETSEGIDHRTVKLIRVGQAWKIESGFFKGE